MSDGVGRGSSASDGRRTLIELVELDIGGAAVRVEGALGRVVLVEGDGLAVELCRLEPLLLAERDVALGLELVGHVAVRWLERR